MEEKVILWCLQWVFQLFLLHQVIYNFTIFYVKSKLINLHFLLYCSCIGNGSFYVCCFPTQQECFKGFFSLHFGLYYHFNYFNFIINSVWLNTNIYLQIGLKNRLSCTNKNSFEPRTTPYVKKHWIDCAADRFDADFVKGKNTAD